ncbi:endonuclease domain-containing protein [Sphingomonas sp.]|uniref:endonuclease domain-containing protein n=1 Tax=Sphingomonas sp. TaxID=28214 RepID=UPI002EDB2BE0
MRAYENHRSGTVQRARNLRRDAPEPERRLLRALREAFPDLKWRHQTPVGPYHADILCFSEKVVIEVDGDTHAWTAEYDAARTRFIEREGYRVLRVTNNDVMQNLDGVIASLSLSLREREGAPQARKGEGSTIAEGNPA